MNIYATYFDSRYLSRALALIESMRFNGDSSKIYALALDAEASRVLDALELENVEILRLCQVESFEPKLSEVKALRSRMEYIFTLTPVLLKYISSKDRDFDNLIYLDSDLYFFDKPDLVVDELKHADVGIIPHRYEARFVASLGRFGTYNVGWVAFKNTSNGLACLEYWMRSCLEWCRDFPENGKYADQGYLDRFPELFRNVKSLQNAAFNLAPWNASNTKLEASQGKLHADGNPLVFFHFHGLKKYKKVWKTAHGNYGAKLNPLLVDSTYKPYIRHLLDLDRRLKKHGISPRHGARRGSGLGSHIKGVLDALFAAWGLLSGTSIWIR